MFYIINKYKVHYFEMTHQMKTACIFSVITIISQLDVAFCNFIEYILDVEIAA